MIYNDILERKLAIIGLGYVGLPLAVEFGKKRPVMGFDINQNRILEIQSGHDTTLEMSSSELKEAHHLNLTHKIADIAFSNSSSFNSSKSSGLVIFFFSFFNICINFIYSVISQIHTLKNCYK